MPDETKNPPTSPPSDSKTQAGSTSKTSPVGAATDAGAPVTKVRAGAITKPTAAVAKTLDVGTDVTNDLSDAIPAFGNVLTAIGDGVANSQTALDQSVIDTVNNLKDTNITVVTQVVEVLGDDGLPDPAQTSLKTQDVSVLNFFTPTVHQWQNVAISMDLAVGSFDQQQGLQFNQTQTKESVSAVGLFWGFLGWFDTESSTNTTTVDTNSSQEVRWKQGQVRVDALLGPRKTSKFPIPANVTIGPQIFVTQGAVTSQQDGNGVVTSRTVPITIEVRKADGSVDPSVPITLQSPGLLVSFTGGTNNTDPNGRVAATLTRSIFPGFNGFNTFQVTASLNQVTRTVSVTL